MHCCGTWCLADRRWPIAMCAPELLVVASGKDAVREHTCKGSAVLRVAMLRVRCAFSSACKQLSLSCCSCALRQVHLCAAAKGEFSLGDVDPCVHTPTRTLLPSVAGCSTRVCACVCVCVCVCVVPRAGGGPAAAGSGSGGEREGERNEERERERGGG